MWFVWIEVKEERGGKGELGFTVGRHWRLRRRKWDGSRSMWRESNRIEDSCNRYVTFCKRRSGIIKKARDLCSLRRWAQTRRLHQPRSFAAEIGTVLLLFSDSSISDCFCWYIDEHSASWFSFEPQTRSYCFLFALLERFSRKIGRSRRSAFSSLPLISPSLIVTNKKMQAEYLLDLRDFLGKYV